MNCFFVGVGKIKETNEEKTINHITHTCSTKVGSSGSPILLRDNLTVIGIHLGHAFHNINYGITILSIINDIKKKAFY